MTRYINIEVEGTGSMFVLDDDEVGRHEAGRRYGVRVLDDDQVGRHEAGRRHGQYQTGHVSYLSLSSYLSHLVLFMSLYLCFQKRICFV